MLLSELAFYGARIRSLPRSRELLDSVILQLVRASGRECVGSEVFAMARVSRAVEMPTGLFVLLGLMALGFLTSLLPGHRSQR